MFSHKDFGLHNRLEIRLGDIQASKNWNGRLSRHVHGKYTHTCPFSSPECLLEYLFDHSKRKAVQLEQVFQSTTALNRPFHT